MYKLLIADDEQVEREALACVAKDCFGDEVEIHEAENGKRAVTLAGQVQPDILMIDIKMPVLNGIDAAKEIRVANPGCKIIMLTGFTYFNYARDSVRIGAMEFLVKPAADEEVIAALQTAMAAVDKTRTEQRHARRNEQKLKLADTYLESQLLAEAIFCVLEEDGIANHLAELKVEPGYYRAAVLFPDAGYGEAMAEGKLEEACREALGKLGQDGLRVLLCQSYGRIHLLLVTRESWPRARLTAWLEHLLRLVTARQRCTAGLGVSGQSRFCADIPLLFKQARKAYRKTNAIQFHSDEEQPAAGGFDQRALEQELCGYLRERSFTVLMSRLYPAMEALFENSPEPRGQLWELLILLNRTAAEFVPVEPTWALYQKLQNMPEEENVKRYATNFLQELIDRMIAQEAGAGSEWVAVAEQYIRGRYDEDVTLEDVAKKVGFSTYYFSRLFKQQLGVSFMDYLTGLRIRRAKTLLADPASTVKDVCFKVGYSEPNYFTRVFKKETGTTPSEYQKSVAGAK